MGILKSVVRGVTNSGIPQIAAGSYLGTKPLKNSVDRGNLIALESELSRIKSEHARMRREGLFDSEYFRLERRASELESEIRRERRRIL